MALLLGLTGCTSSEQGDATRAADVFVAAIADREADRACALLAPASREELEQTSGTPCPETVLDEAAQAAQAGRRLEVSTFGDMAQVRYAEDVVFLARHSGGWRVMAAGCVAQRGAPYSCGIEGR
jgi:hypothetical protein